MSKRTTNRLNRIKERHLLMVEHKPFVASIGTGKPKTGFKHGRHAAKETKVRRTNHV